MVGFEKALGAVKVIKDQIQYRSQRLLNLARNYFSADRLQQFYLYQLRKFLFSLITPSNLTDVFYF